MVQQLVVVGSLTFLVILLAFTAIFRIICLPFYLFNALTDDIESIEKYNEEEDARVVKWQKRLNGDKDEKEKLL